MAGDIITKAIPSGSFQVSSVILSPGVNGYQTLVDETLSDNTETDLFLALGNRFDDKNYYPPRGW